MDRRASSRVATRFGSCSPDRMNQQTRILKTLASLAVAMTATSALLGWIDPSPPLPTSSLSSDELANLGESLVAGGITVRDGRWDKIEISAGHAKNASPSYLTATSRNDSHFLIGLDGRPTRTPKWVRQEAAAQDTHAIRIEVARRDETRGMSRVQWEAVRGLVSSLHARLSDRHVDLPVLLQGAWATAYGLKPGTRLDLSPTPTATQ